MPLLSSSVIFKLGLCLVCFESTILIQVLLCAPRGLARLVLFQEARYVAENIMRVLHNMEVVRGWRARHDTMRA